MVVAPDGQKAVVREALSDLREVPLRLVQEGTRSVVL